MNQAMAGMAPNSKNYLILISEPPCLGALESLRISYLSSLVNALQALRCANGQISSSCENSKYSLFTSTADTGSGSVLHNEPSKVNELRL